MFVLDHEDSIFDHVVGLEIEAIRIENHVVVVNLNNGSDLIIELNGAYNGLDIRVMAD